MTNLRKAIRSGEKVVGTWLDSGSPIVAELLATLGFDFVCVDLEHSAVDLPLAQQLFQAIAAGNPECAPMARLHGVDYALAKRYLDAGARGVIGPLVNTPEQAQLLVDAVRYPPQGRRGVGYCRANQFGLSLGREVARANDELLVAVQIEHIEAVRNIDAILSVPGVDAVFIGPYDLTTSMGVTGQFDHPNYLKARDTVLAACRRHQIAAGIHVVEPNAVELCERAAEGYALLAYSLDITMLAHTCREGLRVIRERLAQHGSGDGKLPVPPGHTKSESYIERAKHKPCTTPDE
jgi:2-dehydro-3-deoxyglucarate aldolase